MKTKKNKIRQWLLRGNKITASPQSNLIAAESAEWVRIFMNYRALQNEVFTFQILFFLQFPKNVSATKQRLESKFSSRPTWSTDEKKKKWNLLNSNAASPIANQKWIYNQNLPQNTFNFPTFSWNPNRTTINNSQQTSLKHWGNLVRTNSHLKFWNKKIWKINI